MKAEIDSYIVGQFEVLEFLVMMMYVSLPQPGQGILPGIIPDSFQQPLEDFEETRPPSFR